MYSLDLTTWKENAEAEIITSSPRAIYSSGKNELWISSWNGACILYNTLHKTIERTFFNHYHDKSALSGNIKNIYYDKSGNYWFCSTEGISIFHPKNQQYKYSLLVKNSGILCGVDIADGRIIFSTLDGLLVYDPVSGASRYFTIPGIDNKKIKTLTALTDTLIAGTGDMAVYYDLKKHTVIRRVDFNGTAQFILKDAKSSLWIGTWGRGLYKSVNNTLLHFDANDSTFKGLLKNSLVCATLGSKDDLWIGYNGGGGFAKYDYKNNRFINYRITVSLDLQNNVSNTVTALEEDSKGNLWIGTYGGGLYYFDVKTNKYSIYLQSDGLLSNFINKLVIANRHLWISTSNGINYMLLPSGKIQKLNIDFVFPSDDVVNSGFKTTDGLLYFFCGNKILCIDPARFFSPHTNSKLLISSFKVFGHEVFF